MRTFVGFGFGPIQAGLFLAEAHLSGNFDRLVVAEVVPEVVVAVRAAAAFTVNVGRDDGIDTLTVRPVEIYSPRVDDDRARLIAAVAEATEMATALPSVDFYGAGGASSVAQILAGGLLRKVEQSGPPAVVYAAENHTQAAELLRDAVLAAVPPERQDDVLAKVQFLDTIIGKMSGAPEEASDLQPLAPGLDRAYLVEAFNRIYISHIRRPDDGGDVAPQVFRGDQTGRVVLAGVDTETGRQPSERLGQAGIGSLQVVTTDKRADVCVDTSHRNTP